jgi:hypothetical protein
MEGDNFEDVGVDGKPILKRVFKKWVRGMNWFLSGSGYGQVARSCECGNEPPCSIKCREFLE